MPKASGALPASSFGCVGNRVYTDLSTSELYTVMGGAQLEAIASQLATIVSANATLQQYHTQRVSTLRTASPA